MKYFCLPITLVFIVGCTSVASVNWVQRSGGDDRSDTWVPECSNCGHVVNYKATQCPNPKDLSLIVWRDKDLFFDFPDDPQNYYTDEQFEVETPVQNEIKSEDVIKHIEEDEQGVAIDNEFSSDTTSESIQKEDITPDIASDFDNLDWEEDPDFAGEDTKSTSDSTKEKETKNDSSTESVSSDFDDIDW